MNKKEIIEKLKKNMPDFTGTEKEKELKKAVYIYVELGKMKAFDEKYYYGNAKTRSKIYRLAKSQKKEPEEIAKKKKIICVNLTYLYCDILKEFDIKAVESEAEEDDHIFPIVYVNNIKYGADLQSDLENIQTRSRLRFFLPFSNQIIDYNKHQELLTQALIECGYIKDKNDYKNEIFKEIYKRVKGKNPHEALEIVLKDEGLYKGNEEMEIVETNKFYRRVFANILHNYFEKKVFLFNCYKQEQDHKEYTLCAFSEDDSEIKPYLFSKKNRKFLSVDIEKLEELEEEGLIFGAWPKENGVRRLKKYIKEKKSKEEQEEDLRG